MGNIRILGGGTNYNPLTSDVVLDDRQLFYSKFNKKLYVGDGETALKDLVGTQIGLNIKNGSAKTDPIDGKVRSGGSVVSASLYDDDAKYTQDQLPVASGHESFAWGKKVKALGKRSFSIGNSNTSHGNCAFTVGQQNTNNVNACLVAGKQNKVGYIASEFDSNGYNNWASFDGSQTNSEASVGSFVCGLANTVGSPNSIVTGTSNTVMRSRNLVSGQTNRVFGNDVIVSGTTNTVYEGSNITTGSININKAFYSIVAGSKNKNNKESNLIIGTGNVSIHQNAIIAGSWNNPGIDNTILFQLGNGSDDEKRSNAFEITTIGQARLYRKVGAELSNDDLLTKGEITQRISTALGSLDFDPTNASPSKTFIAEQTNGQLGGEYVDISIEMNQVQDLNSTIDNLSDRLGTVETDVNAFLDAANIGDAAIDTLKEIQTYIEQDGAAATQMISNISTNTNDINKIINGTTTVGKATNATNAVNATNTTNSDKIKDKNNNYSTLQNALLNMVYPVGSIYMSVNNISPDSFLGGTWEVWGQGKVPVGVDSNDSNFATVEKTGGESYHTLTYSEMPSHDHSYVIPIREYGASGLKFSTEQGALVKNASAGSDIYAMQPMVGGSATGQYGEFKIVEAGGSHPHNNLQPYITCYMWKRIA